MELLLNLMDFGFKTTLFKTYKIMIFHEKVYGIVPWNNNCYLNYKILINVLGIRIYIGNDIIKI